MKYSYFGLTGLLFIIVASGCNVTDNDGDTPAINSGTYNLQAQRTTINEKVVSAGEVGGGYYTERFQFFEGDSLQIEIESDIVSENGRAKATYQIQDSRLSATITATTTSQYNTGEQITFTDFRLVDESFSQTLQANGEFYTFEGPGLFLERQYSDQQDLDDDGNTSETVTQTKYYGRLARYDDGGK